MNKNPNYGLFAIAVAIAIVGAVWLGVPLSTLALLAIVLACPLMMMFMMRGMHGGSSEHHHLEDRENDHDSTSHR
jgi:hypothetical protein